MDIEKVEDEIKRGARNNRHDAERLQSIHDYAVENGAQCSMKKDIDITDETLVIIGAEVKALDDNGKVGGYLVRFSTQDDTDLTGDYFTKNTDFGEISKLPLMYHHGLDEKIGRRRIGTTQLSADDIGLWAESQLNLRDEYEKVIFAMAKAGKLGYSSGAAAHTVEREEKQKSSKITKWYMAEASLTPTPAEPRNMVMPIKSLITFNADTTDTSENKTLSTAEQPAQENKDMESQEVKTLLDGLKSELVSDIKTEMKSAAKEAVKEELDALPEVKAAMNSRVEVVVDESDREFKTLGEQLSAIAQAAKSGRIAPRIRGLKAMEMKAAGAAEMKAAAGANESIPSQGEFLLEPTITSELMKPIHENGVFSSKVNRLPVGPNSNSGWIPGIDETSRATGSRWGGVRGYHAAEAASMASSKPKFRKINWELHKTYVLQYATDELLADAAQMNAIISQSSMEEMDFLMNDDILNGIGGDRPVGILNSSALISVSRQALSDVQHADLVAMWARMPARNKARAAWYINTEVQPKLNSLYFATSVLSPYLGYRPDGVMTIFGKPVIETEFNPALGTAGDILLADVNEYLFWQKGAVEAAQSIHVQFLTDETAFRFIARYDGQSALSSALTPYKGSSTVSPFVCLAATT